MNISVNRCHWFGFRVGLLLHSHSQFSGSSSITLPPLPLSPSKRLSISSAMEGPREVSAKELPLGLDSAMVEEYASLSNSLMEFTRICSIGKAWVFRSDTGMNSKAMFSVSQPNLLGNKMRRSLVSAYMRKDGKNPVNFEWSPFPVELTGVAVIVPSPSGSKLLVVRNPENESPTKFEIWGPSSIEKEFHIPQPVHGSLYSDGWFEGVSWNCNETLIAYVAEEPSPSKPTFNYLGYTNGDSSVKDCNSWKGQGDWEESWGETYVNKRRPTLFVINVESGEVRGVEGIKRSLSAGQVLWAPSTKASPEQLIFVGWLSDGRKLGMKYCYNRSCALYAVNSPFHDLVGDNSVNKGTGDPKVVMLTQGISSAFSPIFSPDGKFLVFLSAKTSMDSGAHCSTNSVHRIDWPSDGKPNPSSTIVDVVPVVMCPENGGFPGLYCSTFLRNPWLSDGHTVILSSIWASTQVILSLDILSGKISRITPPDSGSSWGLLSLDEDNIISVCSSPVEIPQIKYGLLQKESSTSDSWVWQDVSNPIFKCSEEVTSSLSSLQFSIMKIPVRGTLENSSEGALQPFEAIFVSSKKENNEACDPMIVVLHGGPHTVSTSCFSKSSAFLSSLGYSLLIVNYRGSLGFGEEALQSLPGKAGNQDVDDVLTAIDCAIDMKLADPSKIALLGGSHGGFLTTHLIGQAPERFSAAAARNPVCNLALMSGTSDIPEWCFVEGFGANRKVEFTDAPSKKHLDVLYDKSPIAHIDKVRTPTIFLIGAQDLRVPPCNGLQFARALKERGVETKIVMFPEDVHSIEKPRSDFESSLNIGVWFKKYCK